MSDSWKAHGLQPARLLCPWDSSDKNTGVGCHFLFQGIFPTQASDLCLLDFLHCRQILYPLTHQESPIYIYISIYTSIKTPFNIFIYKPISICMGSIPIYYIFNCRFPRQCSGKESTYQCKKCCLSLEDPLEKEIATHSKTFACRIP